jgi:hypothetical protein
VLGSQVCREWLEWCGEAQDIEGSLVYFDMTGRPADDGVDEATVGADPNLEHWVSGEAGLAYGVEWIVGGANPFDAMPPCI